MLTVDSWCEEPWIGRHRVDSLSSSIILYDMSIPSTLCVKAKPTVAVYLLWQAGVPCWDDTSQPLVFVVFVRNPTHSNRGLQKDAKSLLQLLFTPTIRAIYPSSIVMTSFKPLLLLVASSPIMTTKYALCLVRPNKWSSNYYGYERNTCVSRWKANQTHQLMIIV